MNKKKRLCGYYDYTVILTYLGMLAGFTGITFTFEKQPAYALVCLMLAGICDMFDGTVAATKKNRSDDEKKFGIQIDSLSDLICFGVLPAMIVFCLWPQILLVRVISSSYVLCALIRLSYFNVLEEKRQNEESGSRTSYLGLPVTTAAMIMPALYLICNKLQVQNYLIYCLVLLVVGGAFISTIHIKKPSLCGKIAFGCIGLIEFGFLVMGGVM